MINKETGNRLHQQMVDEETGEVVEKENKGRGYELSKGKYVEIEPEELEAIHATTTMPITSRQTARPESKRSPSSEMP